MYEIIKKKVFAENTTIQENLVGLTHDNAASLSGEGVGLIGLLRRETDNYIFDIADPCHCLNLAMKHSLKVLPKRIMNFVEEIHSYFIFPQRKARLNSIQEEKQRRILNLRNYGDTRWLSLGQCLQRLLEIWDSIKDYMETSKHKITSKEKSKKKEFLALFNDTTLRLEIELLSNIIEKINKLNVLLQDEKFHISSLKSEIQLCFNNILELVCRPEKFDTLEFKYLQELDWESYDTQQEWFLSNEEFGKKLAYKITYEFGSLINDHPVIFQEFADSYKMYFGKLLNLLIHYLPFSDPLIEAIDFIQMKDKYPILENKLIKVNNLFEISSESELKNEALPQLLRLRTTGEFFSYFQGEDDRILDVWNRISKVNKFNSIAKFAKLSQILPVSSAGVEQAFSVVKLFKTQQRNSLSQESLEGLLLVFQAQQEKNPILFSTKVIQLYEELKEALNLRKNGQKAIKKESKEIEEENIIEEEKEIQDRKQQSFQKFLAEANPTLKKMKKTSLASTQLCLNEIRIDIASKNQVFEEQILISKEQIGLIKTDMEEEKVNELETSLNSLNLSYLDEVEERNPKKKIVKKGSK